MDIPKILIFDIGGVLVSINKRPIHEFCNRLNIGKEILFDQAFWALQEGKLSPNSFLTFKSKQLGIDVVSFRDLFNSMLQLSKAETVLDELTYPFMLQSNINPLHFEQFLAVVPSSSRALKAVLSYQVGYLKPHPIFFNELKNALPPGVKTTIFIDDKVKNLKAAQKHGFLGVHCPSPQALPKIIKSLYSY